MAKRPAQKAQKAKKASPKPQAKAPVAKARPQKAAASKAAAKSPARAHQQGRFVPTPLPPPPVPDIRPPAAEAITLYERGIAALHAHDYKGASGAFQALIDGFPSEGFLTDRARVYLERATRELARRPAGSGSVEERLTAAQFALNNHNDEEAARLALDVLAEDRSQDLAAYLLAVVAARRGQIETALGHLRDAIAINPECRLQARQDEEFDPLMDSDDFHTLIEAPASPLPAATARKPTRRPGR